MKRYLLAACGLVAGYLLLLVLAGFVLDGYVAGKIEARLAGSLRADVDVSDVSISLLRGKVSLRGLTIERRTGGTILIRVESVDAGIAPLGWSIFDREARTVTARGVDMTLSGRGALALHQREKTPIHVRELVLEDVNMAVMPTALLPRLGRIELRVDRARTGPVVLGSGVSWLFELRELRATADLAGHADIGVAFADDRLSLSGGLFGSRSVSFGFELPDPDPDAFEGAQLLSLAKELTKSLAKELATGWFDREITSRFEDLFD